jgi:regulator of protease activity HflC (stomatin/prohibitin superfamily)
MNQEREIHVPNGWAMLPVTIAIFLVGIVLFVVFVRSMGRADPPSELQVLNLEPFTAEKARTVDPSNDVQKVVLIVSSVLVIGLGVFSCFGYFTLQPNEGRVLILFGAYRGTVRDSGWRWTNPLNTKLRISLRSRNLNGEQLKVNDKRGNPVEIAVVVVWRVEDTAQASFDVDHFWEYVEVQSESAVRHLANCYAYDHGDGDETTLRSGVEEISVVLQKELQERVGKAGVLIEEARLTHLAYAPEIAGAMLRRQQAEAIIDARQKIVHGAVSMVQMALEDLAEKDVVQLDEERKASMVSNLLVVLCGETEAQPVINTGTLYT